MAALFRASGKNAFTIFDEKSQQDISFFSDEDAPVSVGILFDVRVR
jgi:hypothetical protein